ncbi:DNA polymerase III subunit gamma/tau [Patescibacteria group bacterium]|nr:DNA polymerase III subunit gamma/tau [Patescibacteria group bacterium]
MPETQTVLYRKYRPQNWDEVYGQEQVVKVLKGSLKTGKLGHAYLFSGPRGTGKTTMARIFARALGCSDNDIIEIDAASNRGIDDIRALRESVNSLPFDSDKKMYIIDEVHMLTKEAFNALLKTLEEPPSHVVFVLATTELHKVIPTVVSRCQSFTFTSPTYTVLKEMIEGIVKKEGYTIDAGSLDLIAMLGNGSFRDTQGVLQKLMSYSADKKITRDEAELVTGAPSTAMIHGLLTAINNNDTDTALEILHQAEGGSIDAYIFMQMLVHSVRNILKIRFSPKMAGILTDELGEDEFTFLEGIAKEKNAINADLLLRLLGAYAQMNNAYLKYTPIELAILKIIGNNE